MSTVKILFIDDKDKNLESAKTLIQKQNSLSSELSIEAVFVNTGEKGLNQINSTKFDLIISDVFFDYYVGETPQEIRDKLKEILSEYGAVGTQNLDTHDKRRAVEQLWKEYATQWYLGTNTPPTGVLIAEQAIKSETPIVFCSSINHHNIIGEPISQWSQKNSIEYNDDGMKDLWQQLEAEGEEPIPGLHLAAKPPKNYDRDPETKTWEKAFEYGIKQIRS